MVRLDDEAALSSLDSSMKRNNALLRRIRTLSDESRAAVLEEIGTTNQSRFVAEAAAALVEGLQRPREVAAAAEVAAALHRRYADLAAGLEQALARELPSPSAPTTEDRPALVRRRALLRLAVELVATETVPAALTLIGGEVRRLCAAASESGNVAALSLLASLAKAGREELLGLGIGGLSASDSDAAAARLREEIGLAWHAPAGARQQLFAALRAALEAAATRLARERARSSAWRRATPGTWFGAAT
ncbi:hypothetical protein QBZ16_002883 [Prototheca wickerhamii]|uniref:Uncharacterized protein n=1 Tax=Prototheca wickerhamii TaxID=3111 RepID=A0AAD9IMV1_PROWI|nr:hypothetical protein QBZ16_002883 [Prototheca wickerhamii]